MQAPGLPRAAADDGRACVTRTGRATPSTRPSTSRATSTARSLLKGVSHVARTHRIDRIVALDDFDVEMAALLREHLRVPGMGETTARYFRDKLAERMKARNFGILVPDFVHVGQRRADPAFAETDAAAVDPQAALAGRRHRHEEDRAGRRPLARPRGTRRPAFVLRAGALHSRRRLPRRRDRLGQGGRVPVDAPVRRSRRSRWPTAAAIFTTTSVPKHDPAWAALERINRDVLTTFGLVRGVTHTEFIRSAADGRFLFLETSARVGGAFIVDLVEAETGLNLWREWAKLEIAGEEGAYRVPQVARSLRRAGPDAGETGAARHSPRYTDPEIVFRVHEGEPRRAHRRLARRVACPRVARPILGAIPAGLLRVCSGPRSPASLTRMVCWRRSSHLTKGSTDHGHQQCERGVEGQSRRGQRHDEARARAATRGPSRGRRALRPGPGPIPRS